MTHTTNNAFLQRARLEAERYGSDPWVFVRELLQNARDAGAHRIRIVTSKTGGRDRISFYDDGSGMEFEHAQRYLFSLYASSKRDHSRAAGRFGIGFWSVLRFDPDEIVVRSRGQKGEAWQVRFDGRLEIARREGTTMSRGTEVTLERLSSSEDLEQAVVTAVLRDAPFLRRLHRSEHILEVLVNNRPVRAEPTLPPPSMSFRRRGIRGVVGLGPEPRVEVFAHGFRVREAPTLEELLVEERPHRPLPTGTTDGLAPNVIVDSRELQVLMARGDAREDRALKRLVMVGHRELSRLVRMELDRHTDLSTPRKLVERIREIWTSSRVLQRVTLVFLTAVMAIPLWRGMSSWMPGLPHGPRSAGQETVLEKPLPAPYRDLSGRYQGPDVDGVGRVSAAVDLRFRPEREVQYFAALWVNGIPEDGRLDPNQQDARGPYLGASCGTNCLEVELRVEAPEGLLRLPVATGHLLDPESVRLDGRSFSVVESATGQPAIRLERPRSGLLRYTSGPGSSDESQGNRSWPKLPTEVSDYVHGIGGMPPNERAGAAVDFVRRHVAYDTSAETVGLHRREQERRVGLFDRTMAVGAGDCDVQNSLVAAMLDSSGVPARLAVGWVGVRGRVRSGLHAWAEYRGPDGVWRTVDASATEGGPIPIPVSTLPTAAIVDEVQRRGWVWVLLTVAGVILFAGLAVAFWRRRRRSFRAGDAADIVGLLRGAAAGPRAFQGIHSLSSRRLLRLLSGRTISLSKAQKWAMGGSLACGSLRSDLSRRATGGGGRVLDLDQPEAAAVAEVLAAVDLDRWQELLDRSVEHEVTSVVEATMSAAGEPCNILVAHGGGSEVSVLDGLGVGLGPGEVWAVLDEKAPLWRSVRQLAEHRPAAAALVLAETVVSRIGAAMPVRLRCLSRLANDVLIEAAGDRT